MTYSDSQVKENIPMSAKVATPLKIHCKHPVFGGYAIVMPKNRSGLMALPVRLVNNDGSPAMSAAQVIHRYLEDVWGERVDKTVDDLIHLSAVKSLRDALVSDEPIAVNDLMSMFLSYQELMKSRIHCRQVLEGDSIAIQKDADALLAHFQGIVMDMPYRFSTMAFRLIHGAMGCVADSTLEEC